MPICRNSHTKVGSVSRSQCEMPQTSKIKIERQVRFVSEQESRRRDVTGDCFTRRWTRVNRRNVPTPIAEWQSCRLLVAQSIVEGFDGPLQSSTAYRKRVSARQIGAGMALLSNWSSAHVVPQFAKWPHNEASNRVSIDHADCCDVGPGRSLDTNFGNCRSGNGSSI